jgi:hypothetical protein
MLTTNLYDKIGDGGESVELGQHGLLVGGDRSASPAS